MSREYLEIVGFFECVVEKPEAGWFGEAGENATPYIRIPCRVSAGSEAGKLTVWKGWLNDKNFDRTIARLTEVFGFDGDLQALQDGRSTLVNLPCNIETGPETGRDGKTRIKAQWLNRPGGGGGGAKPMEAAKVSSLLGKLNSRAKAIAKTAAAELKANGGAPPAAPRAAAPALSRGTSAPATPPEDDDVPF